MCLTDHQLRELARLVAAAIAPDSLMRAVDIAAATQYSRRYILEVVAKRPDFPRPLRLSDGTKSDGDPRWLRREINAWIQGLREKPRQRGGRKRKVLVP